VLQTLRSYLLLTFDFGSNQENGEVFFAEVKGKPVGCTIIHRNGMINLVGIIPEYRQKGIGTTLLTKTLKYLKQNGHKISYMGTGVPLKGAVALYKKLGYKQLEEVHCMVKEF
jgi:GNAT superfamily N-acetyltransferase